MPEELERQEIESMRTAPWIEHITGQHRIEFETGQSHASTAQHEHIVLGILRQFFHRRVFQHGAQRRHGLTAERRQIHRRLHARV